MKSLIFVLLFYVVFCDESKRNIIGVNAASLPYKTIPDNELKITLAPAWIRFTNADLEYHKAKTNANAPQ